MFFTPFFMYVNIKNNYFIVFEKIAYFAKKNKILSYIS